MDRNAQKLLDAFVVGIALTMLLGTLAGALDVLLPKPAVAGWSAIEASNSGAPPGGFLFSNVPDDLLDTTGNKLMAK